MAQTPSRHLNACGRIARRYDPDRYLAALTLSGTDRERVFTLLAFAAEVARSREAVSETMLGQIRLQWWRDALDEIHRGQKPRRHEVVTPLAETILAHDLPAIPFDRMIEAREMDMASGGSPVFDDWFAFEEYVADTSGALMVLIMLALGVPPERAEQIGESLGTGWGLVGMARATPHLARQRRIMLPAGTLRRARVDAELLISGEGTNLWAPAIRQVALAGRDLAVHADANGLDPAPKRFVKAMQRLLGGHLKRLAKAKYDVGALAVQQPPPWRVISLSFDRLLGRLG